jgi:uncharacterized protein DUF3828
LRNAPQTKLRVLICINALHPEHRVHNKFGGGRRYSEDYMIANAFSRPAISRRDVVVSLIVLAPISALGKEPAAKAFLNEIYRHYVGSSLRNAKGIELTDAKAVRSYFTVGLALLIIEDKTLDTNHGEPPVLDRDLFVGHHEWDISNLAIEVKQIGAFKAIGTVTFTNNGKPEKVVLELQRLGNDWRIADIEWDSGGLRNAFRRRAAYDSELLPR